MSRFSFAWVLPKLPAQQQYFFCRNAQVCVYRKVVRFLCNRMRRTKAVWFIHLSLRRLYLLCLRCSLSILILWQLSSGEYKSYQSLCCWFWSAECRQNLSCYGALSGDLCRKFHWEAVPLLWFCFYVLMIFCVTVCNNIFIGLRCVYTWIRI